MATWSPLEAASRAAASRRWFRSVLSRATSSFEAPASRRAWIASLADSSAGVTRRPLARRDSACAREAGDRHGTALAIEVALELGDLRRRQQGVLLRGFEQRLGAIEVLRGQRRLDLRQRGLRAHRVETGVDFDQALVVRIDAARGFEFGQRVVETAFVERGAGAGDQQAAEALQAFGGFGVTRIEHQHLAEMFQGVVLGGFDVAALVHRETRLLEHFIERGGRRGRGGGSGLGTCGRRACGARCGSVGSLVAFLDMKNQPPPAAASTAATMPMSITGDLQVFSSPPQLALDGRRHRAQRVGSRGNSRASLTARNIAAGSIGESTSAWMAPSSMSASTMPAELPSRIAMTTGL